MVPEWPKILIIFLKKDFMGSRTLYTLSTATPDVPVVRACGKCTCGAICPISVCSVERV